MVVCVLELTMHELIWMLPTFVCCRCSWRRV